jgi:predicted lipoprotein with Yx(FWY)xxD motif
MASQNSRPRLGWLAGAAVAAIAVAGCGSSSSGGPAAPADSGSASAPGTTFKVANVSGLGNVLVDGRGRTVYLLTSGGHNVPCEDSNGCTDIWPDLPLPDDQPAATAGTGIKGSLLKAKKSSDGETYPTYNGWLMYEYAGDSGPAQSNGEGISSFGGTWYAITPAGQPAISTSGSDSGGY